MARSKEIQAKADAPKPRVRADWDAVCRDYRTGKFTLRELAAKYGVSHQAVAKRAKEGGWTQDLGDEIRSATNAVLVQKLVNEEVAKSGQEVANTVVAAAELNAQVIMGHRQAIRDARSTLDAAKLKLEEMGDLVDDMKGAKQYVDGAGVIVSATKNIIELERKVIGLDEDSGSGSYEDELFAALERKKASQQ